MHPERDHLLKSEIVDHKMSFSVVYLARIS